MDTRGRHGFPKGVPRREFAEASVPAPANWFVGQTAERRVNRNLSKDLLASTAMLLLLIAVASLSTLAKNSEYLPESNPAHFLSMASKMKAGHLPVLVVPAPLSLPSKLAPPLPTFRARRPVRLEKPRLQQIDWSVSLQYRPPPVTLL